MAPVGLQLWSMRVSATEVEPHYAGQPQFRV